MEIQIPYKSFFVRLSIDLLIQVLIVLPLFPFFHFTIQAKIIGFLIAQFLSFVFVLSREKYFVVYLKISDDEVNIKYYRYNKQVNLTFKTDEFNLLYTAYYRTGIGLIFRRNKKKFLIQYQNSEWKEKIIRELYDYVKEHRKKFYLNTSVSLDKK